MSSIIKIHFLAVIITLFLTGCGSSDSPKSVSEDFWNAVKTQDMEKAKNLATWDTVDYLKYLKSEKIHPQRFELGEEMVSDKNAEVAVILYSQKQGQSGVKIPGKTVLVKTEQGWRVNVKATLGSVMKQTIDNVFEQLNNLMRDGVKELDKAFSESMKNIGEALEEGANELKNELSKPPNYTIPKTIPRQPPQPLQQPQGQQI